MADQAWTLEIERMLYAGESRDHVLERLAAVARNAPEGSEDWLVAVRALATLGAGTNPWKASLLARRVIEVEPAAFDAWSALGLAQSLLGNVVYAARCYERALRIAVAKEAKSEDLVSLLHNLGHLYDAFLDRSRHAVPLLERALDHAAALGAGVREEIAASLAHALARAGDRASASAVLDAHVRPSKRAEHAELIAFVRARS